MTNPFLKIYQYLNNKYNEYQDDKLLATLMVGVDAPNIEATRMLLKNELRYLNESHTASAGLSTITTKSKLMFMKIARQVIQQILPLRSIIGIQPMQGPVGLVYLLQYTEKNVDVDGRHMQLDVVSKAIQAGSRKLQAGFSLECKQDLQFHGLDFETELLNAIAFEVVHEIYAEILNNLVALSRTDEKHVAKFNLFLDTDPLTLLFKINQQAGSIAQCTRRGAGRVIVTTPMVLSTFQSINKSGVTFRSPSTKPNYSTSGLMYAGDIVSGDATLYQVYVSESPALTQDGKDLILLAYKGPGEVDTGYVYAPYVTLVPLPLSVNPDTFQPMVHMMTRYGLSTTDEGNSRSSGYYRIIEVDYTPTADTTNQGDPQ